MEKIIHTLLEKPDPRQAFKEWLNLWLEWEEAAETNVLYLIGTEIGKGIVPMDKKLRYLRDMVGWCYQDIAKQADRVDLIWYGINEQIK